MSNKRDAPCSLSLGHPSVRASMFQLGCLMFHLVNLRKTNDVEIVSDVPRPEEYIKYIGAKGTESGGKRALDSAPISPGCTDSPQGPRRPCCPRL